MPKTHVSGTGLDVFDTTIHKTRQWLNEIEVELGLDDRHLAYTALRAVLQTLRDRLTAEEAVQLGAQLPMLVRGLYYEGWTPHGKPVKWHREEFLAVIRSASRALDDIDPEDIARVVLGVLARHVSAGEIKDVRNILPEDIRELLEGGR